MKERLKEIIRNNKRTIKRSAFGTALLIFISLCLSLSERDPVPDLKGNRMERPKDREEVTAGLKWISEEEEGEIELQLSRQKPEGDELEQIFLDALAFVDSLYPEETEIRSEIKLPAKALDGQVKLEWEPESYEYFDYEKKRNGKIGENGENVDIRVILTAYGEERIAFRTLKVMPVSEETTFSQRLEDFVRSVEEQTNEGTLVLPEEFEGVSLTWTKLREKRGLKLLLLLPLVPVFAMLREREAEKKRAKERAKQLMYDYPEIVSKFLLLLEAGLTVRAAWERVAKGNGGNRAVYEELNRSRNEMENGISETVACENFGKRCGTLPYLRFSALICQNITKGASSVLPLLAGEAVDAFEERKESAKRLGEEAGTKLLIPMIGLLMIVLGMIMFAAFNNI